MTSPSATITCKGRRWDGWRDVSCGKKAKRDGYCAVHHPDAVARRRAKSEALTQQKLAAMEARSQQQRSDNEKLAKYDELLNLATNLARELDSRVGGNGWPKVDEVLERARKAGLL